MEQTLNNILEQLFIILNYLELHYHMASNYLHMFVFHPSRLSLSEQNIRSLCVVGIILTCSYMAGYIAQGKRANRENW